MWDNTHSHRKTEESVNWGRFPIGPHMLGLVAVFVLAQDFCGGRRKGWHLACQSGFGGCNTSVVQTAIMANWTGKETPVRVKSSARVLMPWSWAGPIVCASGAIPGVFLAMIGWAISGSPTNGAM